MIPQNGEKVKGRSSFIHIMWGADSPFSRQFWAFTVCSRLRFFGTLAWQRGQWNGWRRLQFEQKVKIARRFLGWLQFVFFLFRIVYNYVHLYLPFSHLFFCIFTVSTRYFLSRSQDGHVQIAQNQRHFFYVCANCTNFQIFAHFKTVWVYLLPEFSIFTPVGVYEL